MCVLCMHDLRMCMMYSRFVVSIMCVYVYMSVCIVHVCVCTYTYAYVACLIGQSCVWSENSQGPTNILYSEMFIIICTS